MPSVSLHVPVAIILLGGGLLACFLGYRLLRTLLAVYGFVGGVIVATLFVDQLETWVAVIATIGGGVVGAVAAIGAYLAGVALIGAGLAAFLLNAMMEGEPNVWVLLAISLAGALLALAVRRYVLIVGTSFVGAWTTLVGAMALAGNTAAVAAASGDVSLVFPIAPLNGQVGFVLGWVGLGLLAALVQLRSTTRGRGRVGEPRAREKEK